MITTLYTAEVKLNKKDKNYHKYLLIVNPEEGVLMVDKGLFSISFTSLQDAFNKGVEIINKSHVRDIYL